VSQLQLLFEGPTAYIEGSHASGPFFDIYSEAEGVQSAYVIRCLFFCAHLVALEISYNFHLKGPPLTLRARPFLAQGSPNSKYYVIQILFLKYLKIPLALSSNFNLKGPPLTLRARMVLVKSKIVGSVLPRQ